MIKDIPVKVDWSAFQELKASTRLAVLPGLTDKLDRNRDTSYILSLPTKLQLPFTDGEGRCTIMAQNKVTSDDHVYYIICTDGKGTRDIYDQSAQKQV